MIACATVILHPGQMFACPGCGAALGATVGRGFNMSIYFLMAMPFLVFGSIITGVVWAKRNSLPTKTELSLHQTK